MFICNYNKFLGTINNKDLTIYSSELENYNCSIINVNTIPYLQYYDGTNMEFVEIT